MAYGSIIDLWEGGPEGETGEELREKEWRGKVKGSERQGREEEGRRTGAEKGKRKEGEDGSH